MTSFERDGFHFEAGARALVNAGLVKPLINEFKLDMEILPNPITLGIEDRMLKIEGEKSLYLYDDMLKDLYPDSKVEINKIIQTIQKIMEDMKVLYGVENPLIVKKKRFGLTMFPSIVVYMLKYIRTMYRINKMTTPFEDYLDTLTSNQSLKDIIGQHFFRKTPLFFALSYFALYNEYIYPKGGVGAFTKKLVSTLESLGGEVCQKTEIIDVDAQKKILRDATGNEFLYNKMIWTGDLKALYRMTSADSIPKDSLEKFSTLKEAILAHKGAESVFSVFIATDLPPEYFREKASGHVFYTPNRQGLGIIHTTELQELLQKWDTVQKKDIYTWLERFCQYNTFEISIPVIRDIDTAPPGKTGLIVSTLFDYELICRIRDRGWYDEFKKRMEELFITTLSLSIYPKLKESILFSFSASPLSIFDKVGSSEGSIVGWSFEGTIPVVTKMLNLANSVKTNIPDVYAAGKWVYSPAGGPTAIMTGRIAAKQCD